MASGGHYFTIPGLVATATFASKQYYAVKLASTAGEAKVCSASSDECIGVIQNDAAADGEALVACIGVCKAAVEASVSAGDYLGPSSTGRLTATTSDNGQCIGYALEGDTTSAGDIIRVLLPGISRY